MLRAKRDSHPFNSVIKVVAKRCPFSRCRGDDPLLLSMRRAGKLWQQRAIGHADDKCIDRVVTVIDSTLAWAMVIGRLVRPVAVEQAVKIPLPPQKRRRFPSNHPDLSIVAYPFKILTCDTREICGVGKLALEKSPCP